MNIFMLDENASVAAKMHCDKHVVKMILEYAQLLSTAHRVLDGKEIIGHTKSGRKQKQWAMPEGHIHEDVLYKATHVNHPSAVWARKSYRNYSWLYSLFMACCAEYEYRYGKKHLTYTKLATALEYPPSNIPGRSDENCTPILQAMPDEYKQPDGVKAYRSYYKTKKDNFKMVWTGRETPKWFEHG